jgi:hypothetical protein
VYLNENFIILEIVCLSLPGLHNEVSLTRWPVENRNLLLEVLDAGKSKSKPPANSVSGEPTFCFTNGAFQVSLHRRRVEGVPWG